MPIWTDIITELKAAIDGMTTGGGYNFNYDNVDERRPGSKTYPNVLITYPNEAARDVNLNVIDSYSTDTDIIFKITVDDSVSPVDSALDKVVEDFKRLLESEHDDLQIQGMVVNDLVEGNREYSHIRKRPGFVQIVFKFFYRVRRSNPAITT